MMLQFFPCFINGGGKGGSSKSWVATTITYRYIDMGIEPVVFETDIQNPDVGRIFAKKGARVLKRPLLGFDDWQCLIDEINIIQQGDFSPPIIVNTAATTDDSLDKCVAMLQKAQIKDLRFIWACLPQRSSTIFLNRFRKALPEAVICIVENGKAGQKASYRPVVAEHSDLPEVYYEALSDHFTQLIQMHGIAPHMIMDSPDLSIGEKASAEIQLKIMLKYADEIITKSTPGYVKKDEDSFDDE